MSTTLQRPQYFEGQILSADDLQTSLDYTRYHDAVHARCTHTWGIACGLSATKNGNDFVLNPGVAIDSSGAAIVVDKPQPLDVTILKDQVAISADDNNKLFAVFITRTNRRQTSQMLTARCAGGSQPSRIGESFQIRFRRHATNWDQQPEVGISEGPDDAEESHRVVLIGFVRYDNDQIVGFEAQDNARIPNRPRYVGIRADNVQANGGMLTLRSRPPKTAKAPMIVLDESSEDQPLAFGVDNGEGVIKTVFSVDAKGNIAAEGSLNVPIDLNVGQVFVQSGTATDGAKIPLPTGVSEEEADQSNVSIHIHLTARMDLAGIAPGANFIPVPHTCVVDSQRRVTCVNRWIQLNGTTTFEVPGVFDYLIQVSVPASQGATS